MVADLKPTLQNMRDKLAAMGELAATIGEPTAVGQGLTGAIILASGRVDEVTLVAPRDIHRVTIRLYYPAFQEPFEDAEFALDHCRALIESDFFGDFDLGGTIAYPVPTEFAWDYGYQEVGKTMCRVLDITFPFRVDDNATFVK